MFVICGNPRVIEFLWINQKHVNKLLYTFNSLYFETRNKTGNNNNKTGLAQNIYDIYSKKKKNGCHDSFNQ